MIVVTHGNRPSSITAKLYKNGSDTGKSVTLNSSNGWKGTFTGVEDASGYSVQESSVPTGYSASYSGNKSSGFTITNTLQTTSIKVTKKWSDDSNRDGKRPSSIGVTLYANGSAYKSATLNSSNSWSYNFSNLPQYMNKSKVTYTVKENSVPAGYTESTSGTTITNSHTPERINVNVTKVWSDVSNKENTRPGSIIVELYKNGSATGQTKTLTGTGNTWTASFTNLYKYESGKQITYTVKEKSVPSGYTESTSGHTITNTHVPKTQVSITKTWDDDDDRDGLRKSVQMVLYGNGTKTTTDGDGKAITNPITLGTSDTSTYTFTNLLKYSSDENIIKYEVKEEPVPTGYEATRTNSGNSYTITNKHIPEKTTVKVTKVWDDMDDLDDLRKPITVTLYANGSIAKDADGNTMTVTLNASNNWTHTFTNLFKYYNHGTLISYTVAETVPAEYTHTITGNQTSGYTITNKHVPYYEGYTEITGKVWMDGAPGKGTQPNGTYGSEDSPLKGIKVVLRDANGNQFDATSVAYTDANGNYAIRVNYDNSKNVYKLYQDANTVKTKLQTAYVEFEYDGMKYTTVKNVASGTNTSKGVENVTKRNNFDAAHATITTSTSNPSGWTDKNITAVTSKMSTYSSSTTTRAEVVKRCNGNGTYNHTNHLKAWDTIETRNCTYKNDGHATRTYGVKVQVIPNINLGLFEREQPDVAIFSDLTKVEVTMNGQKYTYLYGVRGNTNDENNVGLKAKFENKDTYTYRRPVNPSDIAYINDGHNNAMQVYVTYEVKVANLSTTLPVTINEIVNAYDADYEIESIVKGKTNGINVTRDASNVYTASSEFKQVKLKGVNIALNAQTQSKDSDTIIIKYKINQNQVKTLLNNQAPLNNAVEIISYSQSYGAATLYAEQGKNGRNGKKYGGYDEDSSPGNAGIHINGKGRLEATKAEDDTDIAPAFVLVKDPDGTKTLSGTIWEDTDKVTNDAERLGNGHKDNNEKTVENVKVELFDIITGRKAARYDANGNNITNQDIYTDANGNYKIPGVVTGEYYVKYTYGNYHQGSRIANELEDEKLRAATAIRGGIEVNARNYKSTIVTNQDPIVKSVMGKEYTNFTDQERMWHITHNDEYTVAVDNIEDRLKIADLTHETYDKGVNMTAFTKPFQTQVEFDTIGSSNVKTDSNNVKRDAETGGILVTGDIDTKNELSKLDFGIIERPQEDLVVQKTISYFKITLANGQILTEGNPSDPNANINYAKTMGFKEYGTAEEARNALPKRLLVEMDAELIQGAKLEVKYDVKVINNNEIDYDYRTNYNYYYFGEKTGFSDNDIIKATIEFVDYINKNLVYNEDTIWNEVGSTELKNQGYISESVEKAIKDNGYKVLQSSENGGSITLARGEKFSQSMTASRLLANQDDNVFDNNAEIIKIDSKTARTIKAIIEQPDGTIERLDYEPGNYEPSMSPNVEESDDDRVEIIITPPTGITNNIMQYVFTALIGLIIAFIVITFIKKKALNK